MSVWNSLEWPSKKISIRHIQEYVAFFVVIGLGAKSIQFAASFI